MCPSLTEALSKNKLKPKRGVRFPQLHAMHTLHSSVELPHKAAPNPPQPPIKPYTSHCLAPHNSPSHHGIPCYLSTLDAALHFSSAISISSNYIISISSNYISRSTEQRIIATVAPAVAADADGQSAQPFLTSPCGQ